MFEGVNWMAVALGFALAFGLGWFWYGPKGFYAAWSRSSGVVHSREDNMTVPFGTLVLGLFLYAVFVGVMVARGMVAEMSFGILTFLVLGFSNNSFKKLGPLSRVIDAGSWAASGAIMVVVQWLL